jgi:hypothetical protein
MMTDSKLINNKTYAAIFFDWKFNTLNGFCPPSHEHQYVDYRKTIANQFHLLHNESVMILKDPMINDSIIDTAIAFKSIIKKFPLMTSNNITVKHFKVAAITFNADMVNVLKN